MFNKILVANRGGFVYNKWLKVSIKVVAVYSMWIDTGTLMADEAIHIGESPAQSSYLDKEKISARKKDAEVVHPGYGFLSENSEFAREVEKKILFS